jgi:hypothetical protein
MPAVAHVLLHSFATLLALFVQFFMAGRAALTNPEWWAYHLTWVAFSNGWRCRHRCSHRSLGRRGDGA